LLLLKKQRVPRIILKTDQLPKTDPILQDLKTHSVQSQEQVRNQEAVSLKEKTTLIQEETAEEEFNKNPI
jgi:hypothetical protein